MSHIEDPEPMEPRIDVYNEYRDAIEGLLNLERFIGGSTLDRSLVHLVKLRASQINGCAYCIDMHTKDALAEGETEQRLHAISAWHETPFFTEQERAALAWTEALTRISESDVPDDLYQEVREYLSEDELVGLTMAIIAINGWNRLSISSRTVPGSYEHSNE